MQETADDLVRRLQQEESDQLRQNPPPPLPPCERPTIHCSELPDGPLDSPIANEWSFYRREVARLLAAGYEGKWVLIKGEEIVGIWDTEEEANRVRVERYLMQPVLMKQVLTRELVYRIGYNRLCRS